MRKRMIDPEYWSDEEIGQWSFEARLFYIGLWNFADDEGRLKAHSKLLKSQIFPYDDKVNIDKLKEEVSIKVKWYEVDKQQYGWIKNFLKHQRIDKPTASKLPPFAEESAITLGLVPPKLSKDKLSKDNIREDKITAFSKPTAQQVEEYAKEIAFSLNGEHFVSHYEACGWKVGRNPMKDWRAAVRTWKHNNYNKEVTNGRQNGNISKHYVEDDTDNKFDRVKTTKL